MNNNISLQDYKSNHSFLKAFKDDIRSIPEILSDNLEKGLIDEDLYGVSLCQYDELIKGKKAQLNETREWGGRKYIKTVQGWKFQGKGVDITHADNKNLSSYQWGAGHAVDVVEEHYKHFSHKEHYETSKALHEKIGQSKGAKERERLKNLKEAHIKEGLEKEGKGVSKDTHEGWQKRVADKKAEIEGGRRR